MIWIQNWSRRLEIADISGNARGYAIVCIDLNSRTLITFISVSSDPILSGITWLIASHGPDVDLHLLRILRQ
jgi:hypothetical protein